MVKAMILNEIIKNRRSVFVAQFDITRKVPDSIIEQMLENANWAPTHHFTEPWRFTVFKGDGIIHFAQLQADIYKMAAGNSFEEKKYDKLLKNPLAASHIIAIGMKRHNEKRVPEIEEISAVAAAVQNMQLTAYAYGVGCYWTTGGITYYPEAKSYFNLQEQDILMGFLYVAYAKGAVNEGKRTSIDKKVKWIRE